jgi:hypothetical protein
MATSESPCWTVIRAAAAGSPAGREELACRYLGLVRAYLGARWRGSALNNDLKDAMQKVFVDVPNYAKCLRSPDGQRQPGERHRAGPGQRDLQ